MVTINQPRPPRHLRRHSRQPARRPIGHRLARPRAGRRHLRVITIVAAIFSTQAAAILTMPLADTCTGAVITVDGFGLGFGITSLARPALLADRYGTTAYASVAGRLAAPVTIAKATAPLAAAVLLHTTGGYTPMPRFAVETYPQPLTRLRQLKGREAIGSSRHATAVPASISVHRDQQASHEEQSVAVGWLFR